MLSLENVKLALVAVACLLLAWTGPSIAHGVHAKFAHDADKVDGKHAVGAGAGLARARGKLVAHNAAGQIPAKFIPTVRNADKVDGLHAASLTNRVFKYTLPVISSPSGMTVRFPDLPPGRYLASFAIVAATSGGMACFFIADGTDFLLMNRGVPTGGYSSGAATGVLDTRNLEDLRLTCGTGGQPSDFQEAWSQVTFLAMNDVQPRVSTN